MIQNWESRMVCPATARLVIRLAVTASALVKTENATVQRQKDPTM